MVFLTTCALAAGLMHGSNSLPVSQTAKPLGPASHIYVAPVGKGVTMSNKDIATYLTRHAVPASVLALLRPLKGTSAVNAVSSMNAVLVVTAPPHLTLSVYMFKPTVTPDLRHAHPVWITSFVESFGLKVSLDLLIKNWTKDHGLRIRKD